MDTSETERHTSVNKAELEELSLLLEDRTFVDYFNIFLSLPVFGQHVFYNFMESEFEFEPPIKQRRDLYLDKREVLFWLCKERFTLFKQCPLYTEYKLSSKLKTTELNLDGVKQRDETEDGADTTTLCKNIMGTATGMLLFRESMRDTCGEVVYRCWKDIEAWRHIDNDVRKLYWKHAIKTKYIHQGSTTELKGRVKIIVFQGCLNFDLLPEKDIHEHILKGLEEGDSIYKLETDDALLQLQVVLVDVLKQYWVPRFLLQFRKQASKETMDILTRPAPGDLDYLNQERRLRCRFMFPTIYQESTFSSPASVFVSQTASEVPYTPETLSTPEEDAAEHEDGFRPADLFSLWAGPAKDITLDDLTSTSTSNCSTLPEEESPDIYGTNRLQSRNVSPSKLAKGPIPIVLTSYLGGKKRTILGKFPVLSNRVLWSLAADALAGNPLRSFLCKRGSVMDIQYLNFWTDVRNYLDTDEHTIDGYGYPLKRLLAHKFSKTYLSPDGEGSHIFSESLKNSLFLALSNNNDVSLLCMAQDIVLDALWEPLKLFVLDERKHFLNQVRGYRYNLSIRHRQQLYDLESKSSSASASDPMFYFQCSVIKRESASTVSPPVFDSMSLLPESNGPRAPTSYHACITEEQMWKAMELTVLCTEYGTSMMVPQYLPKPEHLVDVLNGDYGSLHVQRVPAVRHDWLKSLLKPPKIDIATIKVSRKVELEEIDISSFARKEEKEEIRGKSNRLIVRRNGLVLDRPTKPKSFIEVLTVSAHYDFFKRFMLIHKASMPLLFWRAVEDLKDLSNHKTRQIKVTQIMRKYFGKYAKYGASLDCSEDIIRQIPNMEKVTPGILICAQAAVYRSLERNWYPLYLDTYPPDTESMVSSRTNIVQPRNITPELVDIVARTKKGHRKKHHAQKTLQLWKNLTKTLVEFCRAMHNPNETQLLGVFLQCEVEKEQQNAKSSLAAGEGTIEKNIMMSTLAANAGPGNMQTTRIVVRNRLLILNRLPADLRFWLEVRKYQAITDGVQGVSDTEFLNDKARSVISCFLASDVSPRIQVNVPNDMAANIMNNLATHGPTRGLFHDAMLLLFPVLYHFWKRGNLSVGLVQRWLSNVINNKYTAAILDFNRLTPLKIKFEEGEHAEHLIDIMKKYMSTNEPRHDKFQDEWMNGELQDSYIEFIEKTLKDKVSETPHPDVACKEYTNIDVDDIQTTTQVTLDDTMMKIHFSLSDGIIMVYPQPKAPKSDTGKHRTKYSLQSRSTASTSPRKDTKQPLPPIEKKDTRHHGKIKEEKHTDDEAKEKQQTQSDKRKREKNIHVLMKDGTESQSTSKDSGKHGSPDRARRLSQLVETLNTERMQRIKSQNRRFSKIIAFDEVVTAAMQEISDSGSMFS